MGVKQLFSGIICMVVFLFVVPAANAVVTEEIFETDFETGLGDWQVSNGVWELCLRSEPHPDFGYFYVVTNCDGNYPANTDSRLITPTIDLTGITVTGDEEVHLRFWQSFSYGDDHGYVQVSEDDGSTWKSLDSIYNHSSGMLLRSIDITAHIGKEIRIAFYHTADGYDQYSGWSVDNVSVVKINPDAPPYNFEEGWGDWSASRGVWNVGTPTAGPGSAYEGVNCAGTVLTGNYPSSTDSRFISPSFWVDSASGNEEVHLRFWQWFSYGDDSGDVQISVYEESEGWSEWVEIPSCSAAADHSYWGPKDVDITAYTGMKVRIAFFHAVDGYDQYSGWFVDRIEMITKVPEATWDFECGWDEWASTRGVWQVGVPTSGPSNCYSGTQCAGTHIAGNYPSSTDSVLTSPTIDLSVFNPGDPINLTFMHWYNYGDDYGEVIIQQYDEVTKTWTWSGAISTIGGTSGGWTKHPDIDISTYTGKKIRIGFYHHADGYDQYPGWYIDHIRITGFPHMCECDLNQDTRCDMQDWLFFGEDWGRTDCNDPEVDCECDLNHDGSCDMLDWLRFGEDWGMTDCLICE